MPNLPFEMEHAVQEVVPEGVQRPMDVRSLPANMAIFAGQLRTAVQAIILVCVALLARTRARLDGASQNGARHRITDRFEAYPENAQLTLTLTVGGATIEKSKPDAIERSGHFAFAFTPTVAGRGTATVVLTTPEGTERVVIDNVVVEPDLPTAIAHQGAAPPPDGSIRYSKEAAWDGRFLTTPATKMALASGKTPTLAVSKGAIVLIEGQPHVYVQRDPEAFYLRLVKTGEGNDRYVAVIDGVREGERVVTLGAEKMPRK